MNFVHSLFSSSAPEEFRSIAGGDGEIGEREWFGYAVQVVPELLGNKYKERSIPVREAGKRYGSIQMPRVFYRRESGINPFIVGRLR